jgi:hypothetical protein
MPSKDSGNDFSEIYIDLEESINVKRKLHKNV